MTALGVLRRGLIPNVEGGIAPPMSLNELLYDNVNLDVSQSCAIECGLILKHPLQELDRLYRTKLLDHSFDNFGVSNATIYESNFHCVISIYLSPVPCLGVMRP
jgi:hypothetical protein